MISVGIVGGSGYIGGELLRLLIQHPEVDISAVTSEQHSGEYVFKVHPNLKGLVNLKFTNDSPVDLSGNADVIFMAVPHGNSAKITPEVVEQGTRVIDLSADFRLRNPEDYPVWYGWEDPSPDLLDRFVYGLPELHREELRNTRLAAIPGCIASSSIYSLAPLVKAGLPNSTIIINANIGSSAAGNKPTVSSHFSERYNSVRIYSPAGHRHIAEIEQELSAISGSKVTATMSAHSVNMVRGILTSSSVFTDEGMVQSELWRAYRSFYDGEPFVRFIMDRSGAYRYPDPKIVIGSNFVDLGFASDPHVDRVVAIGALDNLIKGGAGNALQTMNIMMGFPEREGLMTAPMRLV